MKLTDVSETFVMDRTFKFYCCIIFIHLISLILLFN